MADILHRKLSFDVIGCTQRVHSALEPGFPESVYQKAMGHELAKARVPFETEKCLQVWYEKCLCGDFRVDLLVDGKIVLDLKALDRLTDEHLAQALSYLKASGLQLAILMNFGCASFESRRVVL